MLKLENKKEYKAWKQENEFGAFKGDLKQRVVNNGYSQALYVSNSKQLVVNAMLGLGVSKADVYNFDEIEDVKATIIPKLKKKSRLGRLLVGGALIGGAGAIIGYLSGGDIDSLNANYTIDVKAKNGKVYSYSQKLREKDGKRRIYEAQKVLTKVNELNALIQEAN